MTISKRLIWNGCGFSYSQCLSAYDPHNQSLLVVMPQSLCCFSPSTSIVCRVRAMITRTMYHKFTPTMHRLYCIIYVNTNVHHIGFPARVCASNELLITLFHDVVARIESRCVIKVLPLHNIIWYLYPYHNIEKYEVYNRKYIRSKQGRITLSISYHQTNCHGHINSWYVYIS